MANHNDVGKHAEQLAANYFQLHGFQILKHNVRIVGVEIDLVVRKGKSIRIVEVKSRSQAFENPAEQIDRKKMVRLRRAAGVLGQQFPQAEIQIDVVAITGNAVEHLQNLEIS